MYKAIKYFVISLLLTIPAVSFAQEPGADEAEREKKLRDGIEKRLEDYESSLKLEYWQVFYLDSIMTHDYTCMQEEFARLGKARVENSDIYQEVSDRWTEQMFVAFRGVLNDEQWAKYLKMGHGREKKARDKRMEKRKQL